MNHNFQRKIQSLTIFHYPTICQDEVMDSRNIQSFASIRAVLFIRTPTDNWAFFSPTISLLYKRTRKKNKIINGYFNYK